MECWTIDSSQLPMNDDGGRTRLFQGEHYRALPAITDTKIQKNLHRKIEINNINTITINNKKSLPTHPRTPLYNMFQNN